MIGPRDLRSRELSKSQIVTIVVDFESKSINTEDSTSVGGRRAVRRNKLRASRNNRLLNYMCTKASYFLFFLPVSDPELVSDPITKC